jgi:uncharacterized protein YceK
MKRLVLIVALLVLSAGCSAVAATTEPSVTTLETRIEQLEHQVASQQEVIVSITGHFVELSNDYTLLERRVEALEDG